MSAGGVLARIVAALAMFACFAGSALSAYLGASGATPGAWLLAPVMLIAAGVWWGVLVLHDISAKL